MRGSEMIERIRQVDGNIGFYYKNLVTEEVARFRETEPLLAASVIKLPMMVEAFRQFAAGELDPDQEVTVRAEDKVPSCGVLTYLHDGLRVTVRDLVALSIIVSDNTATNMLMDIVTIDKVNAMLDAQDMKRTRLRRKMFDASSSAQGIQNHIAAGEVGCLLEKLYCGELVTPEASGEMLQILKDQQLNSKIPFCFAESIDIAHKTGEDDGITHDVGIVYAREPFIICFCGNGVNTPAFERVMQDMTWRIANEQG